MEASGPTRPLSFRESAIYGFGTLGASAVYSFLNSGAGLYLERYPAVPTWAVGLLSQERSLAGAFVQPIVGAMSDRTRTRIGRRKPFFIAGVALTAVLRRAGVVDVGVGDAAPEALDDAAPAV